MPGHSTSTQLPPHAAHRPPPPAGDRAVNQTMAGSRPPARLAEGPKSARRRKKQTSIKARGARRRPVL